MARVIPVFPWVDNNRSMIYIENLCEFIRIVIVRGMEGVYHPQNQEYVNTSELVGEIRKGYGKKVLYIRGIQGVIKLIGRRLKIVNKIFGDWVYIKDVMQNQKISYNKVSLKKSILDLKKS